MELPEGYANCRYIFSCTGVLEPMSFAIGIDLTIGLTVQEQAEACFAAFTTTVIVDPDFMTIGWTFLGTSVTKTVGGEPVVAEEMISMPGTGAGDALVVNSSVLVRKVTASGGRKHRGRCFLPPYGTHNGQVDAAGNLDTGHRNNLNADWAGFYDALVAGGVSPVLLHSDPLDTPTPITSFVVQGVLATQRRRMR